MGMGDELGLVKEGYLADLLLIDGDPTKDVTIMQNKQNIALRNHCRNVTCLKKSDSRITVLIWDQDMIVFIDLLSPIIAKLERGNV